MSSQEQLELFADFESKKEKAEREQKKADQEFNRALWGMAPSRGAEEIARA